MKSINYLIITFVFAVSTSGFSQTGLQKKADNLFNKFAFANAVDVYKTLIEKNDNPDYATRQIADCYAYMRNPDSAVVYYKKVVEQINIPKHYYYNYAQALRGTKNYTESRLWLKKFKNEGGLIDDEQIAKDDAFINNIFNSTKTYFLKTINFNTKYSEFGALEHNGQIYFTSSRDEGVSTKNTYGWNNEPFLDIYVTSSTANDSIVNHQSKLKGDVNTAFHDGPLTLSNDGKTMYFSRNDFNKQILGKNNQGTTNLKIYKATLINNKWTDIIELPFNSNAYSTGHPTLNKENNRLYFTSDMPGGFGGTDIYYVDIKDNGTFSEPKNLGNIVNTNKNESFPFLNNENTLFFSSDGHPGLGLLDIFATVVNKNNIIVSIINLGVPVNSSKDDFSFSMNQDGLSGFFASNRDGGVGGDDIYAYDRIPQLNLVGIITESESNQPIQNAIVSLLDKDKNIITTVETDTKGQYQIIIDRNKEYLLQTKKHNYIDLMTPISSVNIDRTIKSITQNILMDKVVEELPITELNPIYFDFNKYNIRENDTAELERIVDIMLNKYPKLVLKIESHTDSRGSKKYNEKLSQERAKATYDYLIQKGVSSDRITEYKGFGEMKLTNECNDATKCTEEQHQLNRRTQFIVIKLK